MEPLHPNTTLGTSPQEENSLLDIKRYFFLLLHKWYWLLIGISICLGLAWLYLRYTEDIYEANSTVLIDETKTNRGISEDMIVQDIGFQVESNIENDLQILKSTALMRRVVDSLGLNTILEQVGRIRNTERYGEKARPVSLRVLDGEEALYGHQLTFYPDRQNKQVFYVQQGESDSLRYTFGEVFEYKGARLQLERKGGMGDTYRYLFEAPDRTARRYAQQVQIRAVGQSGVVNMSLQDRERRKATDILSTLIEVYNQSIIEKKKSSGEQTLAFINERLDFITQELYEVESEVEGFRTRNDLPVELSTRASGYLQQINEVDKLLAELNLQLELVERMQAFITQDANRYQTLPVSSDVLSGTLSSLVADYNRLIFERRQKLEAATTENPVVATFDEQLEYLRTAILDNINTIRAEIEERQRSLNKQLAPLERQLRNVPGNERQLLQIMRQQQIKEQLFLFLLQKREETALGIAAQTVNSRILDQPYSRGPVSPNRPQIYLFALILGALLPTTFVLLRDIFDDKIYSQKDIAQYTRAPFIGQVGQSTKAETIVVTKGSRSSVAEMFRLLRTNLQFMGGGAQQQVVLVTSSISGEGKTFVTINLGMSLALTGKRVLLLGFDLRKPKMSKYLIGDLAATGLSSYLIGQAELDEVVQAVPGQNNIDFIGSGPVPPNPSELLMGEPIERLFTELRARYDYILVDTAPVGLVTDALILAELVDQSVMVTRFGKTTQAYLKLAEDIYQQQKLPRFGLILNGVPQGGSYYGYGGYGYGYGGYGQGGYGYYEDDQTKSVAWWKRLFN